MQHFSISRRSFDSMPSSLLTRPGRSVRWWSWTTWRSSLCTLCFHLARTSGVQEGARHHSGRVFTGGLDICPGESCQKLRKLIGDLTTNYFPIFTNMLFVNIMSDVLKFLVFLLIFLWKINISTLFLYIYLWQCPPYNLKMWNQHESF